jgi:acyl-CoA synthetase (AMP-forming)/AMP-acid ligase II
LDFVADPMNLTTSLREQAARMPDAIAFVGVGGPTLTYGALDGAVDAVAARIRDRGLRAGNTVVLATRDAARQLVSALALARLGVAQAAPGFSAGPVDATLADEPSGEAGRMLAIDDVCPRTFAPGTPVPVHDDAESILLYCPSSGTAGERKYVPMTHALALRRAERRAGQVRGVPRHDGPALRLACLIGLQSSFGFGSAMHALMRGGTVVEPDLDAGRLASWLLHSRVSYLVTSPIGLSRLLDALPAARVPNVLDAIEVGGAALPPNVLAAARERLCATVLIGYGLTECGRVAGAEASLLAGKPGAVGFPFPDVEVRIVGDDGAQLPRGDEGLVCVRSPRIAGAYAGDPAGSARTFRDGWVYTGDRGSLDADGLLRIAGRADEVINRGGVKIHPGAVEDALVALGGVREAAAFGVTDDSGTVSLCAAIVPEVPLDADDFHARCRQWLGALAPVFIMHVPSLPRNVNGKVLRQELARMARAAAAR